MTSLCNIVIPVTFSSVDPGLGGKKKKNHHCRVADSYAEEVQVKTYFTGPFPISIISLGVYACSFSNLGNMLTTNCTQPQVQPLVCLAAHRLMPVWLAGCLATLLFTENITFAFMDHAKCKTLI